MINKTLARYSPMSLQESMLLGSGCVLLARETWISSLMTTTDDGDFITTQLHPEEYGPRTFRFLMSIQQQSGIFPFCFLQLRPSTPTLTPTAPFTFYCIRTRVSFRLLWTHQSIIVRSIRRVFSSSLPPPQFPPLL